MQRLIKHDLNIRISIDIITPRKYEEIENLFQL